MGTAVTSIRRRAGGIDLSDRHVLLACVLVTVLLRLPFLGTPLGIDEGGYAYVAEHWGAEQGGIYGGQWVDRPPLLFALYALAISVAGDLGVRLLGCLAAAVVVAACADAARRVAGRAAMVRAGIVATVLASSTALQSHTVNAELPAIACTALTVWLVVRAVQQRGRAAAWLAVGAGASAACALLVKQSFADGLVFAAGFIVVGLVRLPRSTVVRIAAAGGAGCVAVLLATAWWAQVHGPGFGPLLDALYGFRVEARSAIGAAPNAPSTRSLLLLALAALTGLLTLFAFVVVGLSRLLLARQPVAPGIDEALVRACAGGLLAMGAFGLFAVFAGGNWWRHYLIQLVPVLAIGTGIVVGAGSGVRTSRVARGSRRWSGVVVMTTALVWVVTVGWSATMGLNRAQAATGDWLRAAAGPQDTALVTWGNANVLQRSGLATPYDLSWSLPIRVRDPELARLRGIIASAAPPTWIVEWMPFDTWGLDPDGRLQRLVEQRYERVSSVCGKRVFRLLDPARAGSSIPDPPAIEDCGTRGGIELFGIPIR